ncbi:MAG: hypothetical protein CSB33_00575 [Desulfobacterales bacterium]|nr:MAG: hypothetical protein CSB33_00575 [Desulfobacterales bacterium]
MEHDFRAIRRGSEYSQSREVDDMLRLMKLESRIVLDGAGITDAEDHAAEFADGLSGGETGAAADSDHPVIMTDNGDADAIAGAAALLSDSISPASGGLRVVLISDSLPDYTALAGAVDDDAVVIVFDTDGDTTAEVLAKVTDAAASEGQTIDSLTILSHGGKGFFHLGNELVTADSLATEDGGAPWTGLNEVMDDDAHLYVFGCNVSDESGAETPLLDALSRVSGVAVFASSDVTGAGGDWDLEAVSGAEADDADPPLNMDALADYEGVLTTSLPLSISTLEDNPGSYRIFIYGPGEDADSQEADAIVLTGSDGEILQNITLRYDGWITDQPREIDGVEVNEYHRWSLDYDPGKDQNVDTENGETRLYFSVNGTAMSTQINIVPVNDPPEFIAGPNQMVPEDAGLQTVTGWATNILPGPVTAVDESGQNLQFTTTNNNTPLFSVQPAISANGTLTYTPAPGQSGVAEVTVRLSDDGGRENGGEDTSPEQTFTITILSPLNYVENDPAMPVYGDLLIGGNPADKITGATVQITDNYQNNPDSPYMGQDVLAVTETGGISAQWDAATGTLTLTGSAEAAAYQTVLRTVSFAHHEFGAADAVTGNDPQENNRMVVFSMTPEGKSATEILRREVAVDAVNDAPVLRPEDGSVNFKEDSEPVVIDAALQLSDVDDDEMSGAVIQITGGRDADQDVLGIQGIEVTNGNAGSFAVTGNITGSWDAAAGALTLSGAASQAEYEGVLRRVTYQNTSNAPSETPRTISFTVTDMNSRGAGDGPDGSGGALSDTIERTVTVEAVPDPPRRPNVNDLTNIYEDNQGPQQVLSDSSDPGSDYLAQPNDGNLISEIVQSIEDPDAANGQGVKAIAVTAVDDARGTWEYWVGGNVADDANWRPIDDGRLGVGHALLLDADARIRFMPKPDFNTERPGETKPSITVHSWDETTTEGAGEYAAITGNPGFSEEGSVAAVAVLAVNDAPQILNLPSEGTVTLNENLVITGASIEDIDVNEGGSREITVTLSAEKGTITLSTTDGLLLGGDNGSRSFTITGALAQINAAMATMTYDADDAALTAFQAAGTPDDVFDTIQVKSNDNGSFGLPGPRHDLGTIPVFLGNTGPVIDLDPDDDGGEDGPAGPEEPDNEGTYNFNVYFIEDTRCTPVLIADSRDPAPLVAEPDGEPVAWMEIRLTNPRAGDELDVTVPDGSPVSISSNGIDPMTGDLVIRLEGEAADTAYDAILRTATFNNTLENPDASQRIIKISAADNQGNAGIAAISRISVVPVNDGPENLLNAVPIGETAVEISGSMNQNIVLSLGVDDAELNPADNSGRIARENEMSVQLEVNIGILSVNAVDADAVRGNGTANLTLTGTFDEVNSMLAAVSYSPDTDFSGTVTLQMTSSDHGYTGIPPSAISVDGSRCTVTSGILDSEGNILPVPNEGTPADPSALTDVSIIRIRVLKSDDNPVPEGPGAPDTPMEPIVRPEGYINEALRPGVVTLPGDMGITGGKAGINISSMGDGGREVPKPFCSIEEALRVHLGCRFANTGDDQAKFGSLEWEWMHDELGWTPPYEYLGEEWDLYSRLFLREEGDPGFNVYPGELESGLGGIPEEKEPVMDPGSSEKTLNEMGPEELKKAFFAHRPELDRLWR